MSVSNASFIPEQERKRKLVRQATHGAMQIQVRNLIFSKISLFKKYNFFFFFQNPHFFKNLTFSNILYFQIFFLSKVSFFFQKSLFFSKIQDGSGFSHHQEQINKGWQLLSTLHCSLLPGKLRHLGSKSYKKPNVEQLAIRYYFTLKNLNF